MDRFPEFFGGFSMIPTPLQTLWILTFARQNPPFSLLRTVRGCGHRQLRSSRGVAGGKESCMANVVIEPDPDIQAPNPVCRPVAWTVNESAARGGVGP